MKLTQSARRRKVGVARAVEAINDAGEPVIVPADGDSDERQLFVGRDHTGLELEVMAVQQADHLLVIHVMPTGWRKR